MWSSPSPLLASGTTYQVMARLRRVHEKATKRDQMLGLITRLTQESGPTRFLHTQYILSALVVTVEGTVPHIKALAPKMTFDL